MIPATSVTQLLLDWRNGNHAALDQMIPLVYDELRHMAHRYVNREAKGNSLFTADLVNEVYLKLVNEQETEWQDRAHFFAVSAQIMRHLLVDRARAKQRAKRGGAAIQVALKEELVSTPAQPPGIDLLALDQALDRLAQHDERKCRIVELRYFGGLSVEETAVVLGLSAITIKREWLKARAWLFQSLSA